MENSRYKFRVWDGEKYHYDIAIYDGKAYIPDHGLLVEPVENAIIEQYTGLKDKNGKEIYEGDIIKNHNMKNIMLLNIQPIWLDL